MAQLLYDRGDVDEAKEQLETVVERWPDVTAGVSLLCRIYEREGSLKEAAAISARLLDFYPDLGFVQKLAGRYRRFTEPYKAPATEMKVSISPELVSRALEEKTLEKNRAELDSKKKEEAVLLQKKTKKPKSY